MYGCTSDKFDMFVNSLIYWHILLHKRGLKHHHFITIISVPPPVAAPISGSVSSVSMVSVDQQALVVCFDQEYMGHGVFGWSEEEEFGDCVFGLGFHLGFQLLWFPFIPVLIQYTHSWHKIAWFEWYLSVLFVFNNTFPTRRESSCVHPRWLPEVRGKPHKTKQNSATPTFIPLLTSKIGMINNCQTKLTNFLCLLLIAFIYLLWSQGDI